MTTTPDPPRPPEQREQDTLARLAGDVDAWVATSGDGTPHLIPLSYLWDGSTLLMATPAASPTARNLCANGEVRVGVGPTRDVVMIHGTATPITVTDLDDETGDRFATATGFDPRILTGYQYFRIRPARVQAWRESNEIAGRDLMRDGRWRT